ncbi:MAG: ABC transporter ATP-binding protein [Kiritimatiellae bacterium]|nr:ABC transporter ATP-binding protein [Kiritimatiellia bacterium]
MSFFDASKKRKEPRYKRRISIFRPEREHVSYNNPTALIFRFYKRYLHGDRRRLFIYLFLSTLTSCSIFLMGYFNKYVIDKILVINDEKPQAVQERHYEEFRTETAPILEQRRTGSKVLHDIDAPAMSERSRYTDAKQAESYRSATASKRPANATSRLVFVFVAYILTFVLLNETSRLATNVRHRVAQGITIKIRTDLHERILSLSTKYHQATTPGRLLARIISDVDAIQADLLNIINIFVSQSLMIAIGLIILFLLDWHCALIIVAISIPYFLLRSRTRKYLRSINRELRHTNACLWGLVSQKLDAMKAIFAYGCEKLEKIQMFRLSSILARDSIQNVKLNAGINRSAMLISQITQQTILIFCAYRVINGNLSLGSMMFIIEVVANIFGPLLTLAITAGNIASTLVLIQRITSTLENPEYLPEAENAVAFPKNIESGISINDLSFRYDKNTRQVLSNINIDIPIGQWVCIIGPSGSGKTTLINLLARLYDPTTGSISIGSTPMTEIAQDDLHKHISLVPQEAQIMSGTVRNNIVYGTRKSLPTEIIEAAKAADCHDFVMKLPVKYETVIGEKGQTLSGGQRQRISIARAIITNPDVLLLDDCTSALDAKTERKLQETLTKIMEGKTAVIVSQRISMAMRCHKIVVLEDGFITAQGTHQQLMHRSKFYAELYETQMGGNSGNNSATQN